MDRFLFELDCYQKTSEWMRLSMHFLRLLSKLPAKEAIQAWYNCFPLNSSANEKTIPCLDHFYNDFNPLQSYKWGFPSVVATDILD